MCGACRERERNVSGLSESHDVYLTEGCCRPGAGDDGVDEAGGDVPPLPSLLLVVGGGCRDQEPSQEVDNQEGGGARENSAGHAGDGD